VRSPEQVPRRPRRATRRGRIWLIVALFVVLVLVGSVHTVAVFFTDYLWFGSVQLTSVWRRLLVVKVSLFAGFAAAFFVVMWVNLMVVDRLAPRELALGPEDELVRRYQQSVAPHAVLVRSAVALVLALVAASGTAGQWRNWLLFSNATNFGVKDPQFHKDVGFFVFKLPFLSFLVNWSFVALVVVAIVTLVAHYLNGGIRVQANGPRVAPQVKVHVSILLALVALVKAAGYVLERYSLDLSGNGFVQGAGWTDVHARLPALTLLTWISLAAAVILVGNIWRRGWALPVLAVGLWGFVAVVIGTIYPAAVQAFKVTPAQGTLERPYIARNIAATRAAMGIDDVKVENFAADQSLTAADLNANGDTTADVRLWDPALPELDATYTKSQAQRGWFIFNTLALDRYQINGVETPAIVAVRQVNVADLPNSSWVNRTLTYTHGYGMIVSPANEATSPDGQPIFAISDLPPVSTDGLPPVTQPSVYFGLSTSSSDAPYVIADSRQPEVDYPLPNGTNVQGHYHGDGGILLNNFVTRAAFAIRFGDLNLLISDLITPKSRLMFVRDIRDRVTKAAPFLSLDSNPYPVLVGGRIEWVQDAYTTSDHYPYAQPADTTVLPAGSGLPQNFNYIRNSVKVVTDAYTGKMTFYVMDPTDPVIRTWEKAFPALFTPASKMPPDLVAHIRYPQDIFAVQAAAYGRYRITNPSAFYNAGAAWSLSQDPGSGSPSAQAQPVFTTNAQGQLVSTGQTQRMQPLYQVLRVPGQDRVTYNLMDAFVPVSKGNQLQTLAGFMVAGCDPGEYGKLTVFQTPPGQSIDGPALVEGRIQEDQTVSSKISLLDRNGSSVLLGNVLMVPVNQSMLYFRPLYVQASRNAVPELQYVIVVYSGQGGTNTIVKMEPTLQGALQDVFQGASVPTPGGQGTTTPVQVPSGPSPEVQADIDAVNTLYQQAQADLRAGNFAAYGSDITQLGTAIAKLQQDAATTAPGPGSTSTTTAPAAASGPGSTT